MGNNQLQDIPTEAEKIDDAVDKVQMLVLKTYSFIRAQVCDQVELFAEAFFKLPTLRHLHDVMHRIQLSDTHKANYESRRQRIDSDMQKVKTNLTEIDLCIERLNTFRMKTEAKG